MAAIWIRRAGGANALLGSILVCAACAFSYRQSFYAAVFCFAASLPCWLPPFLIAVRFRLLTDINGDEGIQLPNEDMGVTDDVFKWLYNHESAGGRSQQANYGLSDFFWYLLAPAHAVHQEHIESDDIRYQITASVTRKLVAVKEERLIKLATKHAERLFSEEGLGQGKWDARRHIGSWEQGFLVGNLRDLFFPLFERMIYELLFDSDLDDAANAIMTRSAENVLNGIKGVDRRNMSARQELCNHIMGLLSSDKHKLAAELDPRISVEEWALFLQGVFFTTGVVQLAEGMTHLALALAQHPAVLRRLREEEGQGGEDSDAAAAADRSGSQSEYLNDVIREMLRVWPLFGIAHRITSEDIQLPTAEGRVLPKGSVLCFNYPKYHASGFAQPSRFEPGRWASLKERDSNYLPFGAKRNRPCPGQRISLVWMRAIARVLVRRVDLICYEEHTRSLPCGGYCLITPRKGDRIGARENKGSSAAAGSHGGHSLLMRGLLLMMRVRCALQPALITALQFVNEMLMLRESKKLQLAQKYYSHYEAEGKGDLDNDEPNKPCLSNQLYR